MRLGARRRKKRVGTFLQLCEHRRGARCIETRGGHERRGGEVTRHLGHHRARCAERGTDTTSHLKNGVDRFQNLQLIAVAPQCPPDDTFGGSWYGGDSLTQQRVISLVRSLGQRRSVDPRHISLVGFSMGAIGLWAMLEKHQGNFTRASAAAGIDRMYFKRLLRKHAR
jgi:predicted peptidase